MTQSTLLKLFNFDIFNGSRESALARIFDGSRQTVAFLNAHCINVAAKDTTFRWALDRASVLLPDGSGLQVAAKLHGSKFVENLNGTDLFPHIMQSAKATGY